MRNTLGGVTALNTPVSKAARILTTFGELPQVTYKMALPRLLLLFDSVQLSVLNLRAREKSKTISVRTLEEHHHRITLSLMGPTELGARPCRFWHKYNYARNNMSHPA